MTEIMRRPAETRPHRAPTRHRPAGRRGGDDLVVVGSVRRFCGLTGVYEARWRDGRHRRRVLVVVDDWARADELVAASVRAAYAGAFLPRVEVPLDAWR